MCDRGGGVVDFRALNGRKDEEVAYNTIYINRKALTGHSCMDFGVTVRNSLTWAAIHDWLGESISAREKGVAVAEPRFLCMQREIHMIMHPNRSQRGVRVGLHLQSKYKRKEAFKMEI